MPDLVLAVIGTKLTLSPLHMSAWEIIALERRLPLRFPAWPAVIGMIKHRRMRRRPRRCHIFIGMPARERASSRPESAGDCPRVKAPGRRGPGDRWPMASNRGRPCQKEKMHV
jgi:hypothetical protein